MRSGAINELVYSEAAPFRLIDLFAKSGTFVVNISSHECIAYT